MFVCKNNLEQVLENEVIFYDNILIPLDLTDHEWEECNKVLEETSRYLLTKLYTDKVKDRGSDTLIPFKLYAYVFLEFVPKASLCLKIRNQVNKTCRNDTLPSLHRHKRYFLSKEDNDSISPAVELWRWMRANQYDWDHCFDLYKVVRWFVNTPYTKGTDHGPDADDVVLANCLLKYVKKNFPGTLDKLTSEEGECTFNKVCECLDKFVTAATEVGRAKLLPQILYLCDIPYTPCTNIGWERLTIAGLK